MLEPQGSRQIFEKMDLVFEMKSRRRIGTNTAPRIFCANGQDAELKDAGDGDQLDIVEGDTFLG